ncbi:hypothetical protein PTMSG1_05223 [Pyrenophora teres f. maculata]|nr:hypothetical protein PTMSG1_05223 [Pyrenophora teres f. maculata]
MNESLTSASSNEEEASEGKFTKKQQLQWELGIAEYEKLQRITRLTGFKRPFAIVAIDVEKDETKGSTALLEIEIDALLPSVKSSGYQSRYFPNVRLQMHIIIRDHLHLNNKFAPSDKFNYVHGTLYQWSEKTAFQFIDWLIQTIQPLDEKVGGGLIVGHTIAQDIKWIKDRAQELKENIDVTQILALDKDKAVYH